MASARMTTVDRPPLQGLAALIERVRPSLMVKVVVLEDALAQLLEAPLDAEHAEQAQRAAHQLAGAAGTFGMPHGTELARALETFFRDGAPTDPVLLLPAFSQLEELRGVLEAGPRQVEVNVPGDDVKPTGGGLLFAVADPALGGQLVSAAQAIGRAARQVVDLATAGAAATEAGWVAALVDLTLPAGRDGPRTGSGSDGEAGRGLLVQLRQHQPDLKILVLGRGEAFLDRVEASRAGAHSFVDAAQPAERIVQAMVDSVKLSRTPPGRGWSPSTTIRSS